MSDAETTVARYNGECGHINEIEFVGRVPFKDVTRGCSRCGQTSTFVLEPEKSETDMNVQHAVNSDLNEQSNESTDQDNEVTDDDTDIQDDNTEEQEGQQTNVETTDTQAFNIETDSTPMTHRVSSESKQSESSDDPVVSSTAKHGTYEVIEDMGYRELQSVASNTSVKGNQKHDDLLTALKEEPLETLTEAVNEITDIPDDDDNDGNDDTNGDSDGDDK